MEVPFLTYQKTILAIHKTHFLVRSFILPLDQLELEINPRRNMASKQQKQRRDSHHSAELREKIVKTVKTVSPFSETPSKHYTWDQLQDIEKHRRQILTRVEDPFWKTLSYWDGTCLKILLYDSLNWIVMGIYVGIRMQARLSVPTFVAQIGSSDIAVMGGFLSFFLVFYVNQSHKRFFGLYDKAMACKGRIFDVATLAVTHLPKEVAMRLVRYMNAAHAVAYVGLSKTYSSSVFFEEINKELGLLTDEEYERMKECDLDKGGSCNRELIAWCMAEVQRMHKRGFLDAQLAEQFRTQVLGLRAHVGALYNGADLPIPFFYGTSNDTLAPTLISENSLTLSLEILRLKQSISFVC